MKMNANANATMAQQGMGFRDDGKVLVGQTRTGFALTTKADRTTAIGDDEILELDKLLMYPYASLSIWLAMCLFWLCFFWLPWAVLAAKVAGFQFQVQEEVGGAGSRSLQLAKEMFQWTFAFFLGHFALVIVRHHFLCVRAQVYAFLLDVIRCAFYALPIHAVHGLVGGMYAYGALKLLQGRGLETVSDSFDDSTALVSGIAAGMIFSCEFILYHQGRLQFPILQKKRFARLRQAIPAVLSTSLRRSLLSSVPAWLATSKAMQDGQGSWLELVLSLSIGWLVHMSFRTTSDLHMIFLTESKRLGDSTTMPVGDGEEVDLLLRAMKRCDEGSLEEALLSFPLPDMALMENTSDVLKAKLQSSLLEFARGGENPRNELDSWWVASVDAILRNGIASPWEQIHKISEKRFNTVLQAIYTADAKETGRAFWGRKRTSVTSEIVRARAFLDVATLTEFSEDRRRVIFTRVDAKRNKRAWIELVEVCTSCVDALTLELMVSVDMCAFEPTIPLDKDGRPNAEAFVLGPPPSEEGALSEKDRVALAWRAEEAARRHRSRPWISRDWWYTFLFSGFHEFDPVAMQRRNFEEQLRLENDFKGEHAWERQWKQQQRVISNRWSRTSGSWLRRTPRQCTSALFADAQVVIWSIQILSGLVGASTKEDELGVVQHTIPVIASSLLCCLQALEKYVKSASFGGGSNPPLEFEPSEAEIVRFHLERGLYKITTQFNKHLQSFKFPEIQADLLERFQTFQQ